MMESPRRSSDIVQNVNNDEAVRKRLLNLVMKYGFLYAMLIYVSNAFGDLFKFVIMVVLVIWSMNIYMYFKVPFIRKESLKSARVFTSGYLGSLIALQMVIRFFWHMDAQDVTASLDPSVVNATDDFAITIVRYLVNFFLIVSISAPIGYLIAMFQKRKHYVVGDQDTILKRYRKM